MDTTESMAALLAENRADLEKVSRDRSALAMERLDLIDRARAVGVTWRQIEGLTGATRQGITTAKAAREQ